MKNNKEENYEKMLLEHCNNIMKQKEAEYATAGNRIIEFEWANSVMNYKRKDEHLYNLLLKHLFCIKQIKDGIKIGYDLDYLLEKCGDAYNYCELAKQMIQKYNKDISITNGTTPIPNKSVIEGLFSLNDYFNLQKEILETFIEYAMKLEKGTIKTTKYEFTKIEYEMNDEIYFRLIEKNGKGYGAVLVADKRDNLYAFFAGYVQPSERGKGIGKAMLLEREEWAKNYKKMKEKDIFMIELLCSNKPEYNGLYEKYLEYGYNCRGIDVIEKDYLVMYKII